MFRILSIIAGAGPNGISTVALHEQLGAHTNRTNAIIRKAHEMGLIDRIQGERPGPGQFAPIFNVTTEKGRKLLASAV
jgi:DNA-binding MarR family transcriptional regulator